MKNFFLCFLLLNLPLISFSKELKYRTKELLQEMNSEKMQRDTINLMLNQQLQSPKFKKLPKKLKADYRQLMHDILAWKNIEAHAIKIYQQHFTQQEIHEMTEFYRTPTGKKALEKFPIIMAQTSQWSNAYLAKNQHKIIELLEKYKSKKKK